MIKKSGLFTSIETPVEKSAEKTASTKLEKDFKAVLFRMSVADWRRLKQLSLDSDSSMQQLIEDGMNTLLRERGLPALGGKK